MMFFWLAEKGQRRSSQNLYLHGITTADVSKINFSESALALCGA